MVNTAGPALSPVTKTIRRDWPVFMLALVAAILALAPLPLNCVGAALAVGLARRL